MFKFLKNHKLPKEERFDHWISRFHGPLYKHALWMVGNRDSAQEMTQEAFFQAWLSMDSLKDDEKVLPWLLTILRRAVYRELRYQYQTAETLAELKFLDGEATHPDAYSLMEIYSALDTLAPILRETFLLHHLHGFSYEEIGGQLEIPTGTVMSRISRARDALQKYHKSVDEKVVDFMQVKRGAFDEGR